MIISINLGIGNIYTIKAFVFSLKYFVYVGLINIISKPDKPEITKLPKGIPAEWRK